MRKQRCPQRRKTELITQKTQKTQKENPILLRPFCSLLRPLRQAFWFRLKLTQPLSLPAAVATLPQRPKTELITQKPAKDAKGKSNSFAPFLFSLRPLRRAFWFGLKTTQPVS